MAWLKGLDQLGPVFFRSCQHVLVKGRPERRFDNGAVFLADKGQGQCIAHEMHATALDGGAQYFGGGTFQTLVFILCPAGYCEAMHERGQ